ncbi:TPA: Gfo/Idh/MocA family oxidoreductase [Legionella pneumophila]|uniref:Gfo/Idh/MocA family protein n=1 Tax=Legionella pneumophila TaxID=446 RepID=UPI00078944D0|nr:Gfo/Idh/MocA family oxidoreductase [Legionella pneumophila]MDW8880197.1 Gfo/Idh/MocA family oxidoreductase [Legionella pneumophila subsp. fraseri]MDW8963169.1 Gfo/Idh/MocA family oxidoreductase [Legionella pneumophila subsp. fraseri]MDW9036878.1 Gfo/Idh/MocA family oxidoreductase [Legionella pneumophila subsp. fraseri]MDW9040082.1 Gfo/Idh/MocA family oxidoreductase [Legionella pneumophila subsp. fraseri]MDW9043072.1 Gfo/Idh/MocA family oxidoreductase [Legionella pneumophila subsp. fraseri]
MNKIRCAVIGVGYLGRFHAQKYQLIPNAELVAVCDVNSTVCEEVSRELNVPAYINYRDLFGKVEAVSIAATTNKHFEIAKFCLQHGIHVLIEKPITETVSQAEELIQLARQHQVKLQVGHLERFNSARLALDEYLELPLFIESQRLAPFNPRGTDVNVILDLMIHDIDIIQNIVQSPIKSITAQGAPVLTKAIDIANARITFANHCVANVTASRISFKTERKTRIFQENSYISIDYQNKQLAVFKKGTGEMFPGIPDITRDQREFEKGDALLEEIKAFLNCIENDRVPLVTGEEGRDALKTAEQITALINNNLVERYAEC